MMKKHYNEHENHENSDDQYDQDDLDKHDDHLGPPIAVIWFIILVRGASTGSAQAAMINLVETYWCQLVAISYIIKKLSLHCKASYNFLDGWLQLVALIHCDG